MKRRRFDAGGFFLALDAQRQARRLSWRQVAAEAGVSASTLTRMSQGKRPDVESLAALCAWGGLAADDFMSGRSGNEPRPLAMISTYLRSDPNLDDKAAEMLDRVIKAAYEELRTRE